MMQGLPGFGWHPEVLNSSLVPADLSRIRSPPSFPVRSRYLVLYPTKLAPPMLEIRAPNFLLELRSHPRPARRPTLPACSRKEAQRASSDRPECNNRLQL